MRVGDDREGDASGTGFFAIEAEDLSKDIDHRDGHDKRKGDRGSVAHVAREPFVEQDPDRVHSYSRSWRPGTTRSRGNW